MRRRAGETSFDILGAQCASSLFPESLLRLPPARNVEMLARAKCRFRKTLGFVTSAEADLGGANSSLLKRTRRREINQELLGKWTQEGHLHEKSSTTDRMQV